MFRNIGKYRVVIENNRPETEVKTIFGWDKSVVFPPHHVVGNVELMTEWVYWKNQGMECDIDIIEDKMGLVYCDW